MALTTLYLRHQLRRTLSHLTTTTTKHLIPYSSPQRLTNTTAVTYRNFHFPRSFSSASRSSNDIDEVDAKSNLFEGCDYKHWLIVMHFGNDKREYPPADQMVQTYIQTAAKVLGSVEEAKKRIYACSTTTYTGFQLEVDQETSQKFEGLPGVMFVLPESYIDPINKEYGGMSDKFINGEVIRRPPPVQHGRTKRPDRSNDPRERSPMSDQQRNPAYNQQGNPPYNQPRNPPYNQQANPPYNRQGNPTYNRQGNLAYNQQGNPAYNQQESTRGYGRSYNQQNGFQQQPPQQNYQQGNHPGDQGQMNNHPGDQGQMNNHPGDQGSFVPPGQGGN